MHNVVYFNARFLLLLYSKVRDTQCEVGEQCRVQAGERSQKNGAAFGLIVAVSRDYSWMAEVVVASLMEFLARNRFCRRSRVYLSLTTEMNFYPIRKQRLRLNIDVIRCSKLSPSPFLFVRPRLITEKAFLQLYKTLINEWSILDTRL